MSALSSDLGDLTVSSSDLRVGLMLVNGVPHGLRTTGETYIVLVDHSNIDHSEANPNKDRVTTPGSLIDALEPHSIDLLRDYFRPIDNPNTLEDTMIYNAYHNQFVPTANSVILLIEGGKQILLNHHDVVTRGDSGTSSTTATPNTVYFPLQYPLPFQRALNQSHNIRLATQHPHFVNNPKHVISKFVVESLLGEQYLARSHVITNKHLIEQLNPRNILPRLVILGPQAEADKPTNGLIPSDTLNSNTPFTTQGLSPRKRQHISPYNQLLLLKYDCKIKIETAISVPVVKYKYKYISKKFTPLSELIQDEGQDEVAAYIHGRFPSRLGR